MSSDSIVLPFPLHLAEVHPQRVHTPRLELVAATAALIQADLDGPAALGAALGATVPADWPPDEWDEPALRWMLAAYREERIPVGWGAWYVIRRADRVLVGSGGLKGPPDATGTAEIGYGVAGSCQRRGYGTETAEGLVAFALADARVNRVIAETLPELAPSIGVLRKLGFSPPMRRPRPG